MKINRLLPAIRRSFTTKNIDKDNLKWLLSNVPIRNENDEFIATSFKTSKGTFTDLRIFNRGINIKIGKSELNLDTNGKITSYKKPFFKSLNKLVDKSVELINYISTNMTNKELVHTRTLKLMTFPKDTLKKLKL